MRYVLTEGWVEVTSPWVYVLLLNGVEVARAEFDCAQGEVTWVGSFEADVIEVRRFGDVQRWVFDLPLSSIAGSFTVVFMYS